MFSTGGNVLINIGPTSYGKIIPIFEERLRQMGSWLKVNGEAIYGSVPWKHQNDTINKNVWYIFINKIMKQFSFFSRIGTHNRKTINLYMPLFLFGRITQLRSP
jgi:alpha-L-fucosidase